PAGQDRQELAARSQAAGSAGLLTGRASRRYLLAITAIPITSAMPIMATPRMISPVLTRSRAFLPRPCEAESLAKNIRLSRIRQTLELPSSRLASGCGVAPGCG